MEDFVDVKKIIVVAKFKETKGQNTSETWNILRKNNNFWDYFHPVLEILHNSS